MNEASPAALDDLRVLDLTDASGVYCTKLLADLGADVIRVEPPGGHPMRRIGPFLGDDPDGEKSLHHLFFNTNKRSVTLDVEHADGRDLLRRLAATTAVIVETFRPGYLDGLGLGYETLARANPGLILASITPFGQTGPWKDYRATSIVADALGGLMYVTGSPEDPPIMSKPDQAYYLAGEQAAVGTLIAVAHRDLTGEGQQIDVSMQECVALAVQPQSMFWPGRQEIPGRFGYGERTSTQRIYTGSFYRCKDGWVAGIDSRRRWEPLVRWLSTTGLAEDLADPRYLDQAERDKEGSRIQAILERAIGSFTMAALVEDCQKQGLFVFPTYTAREIVKDPHLRARGFFTTVIGPDGEELVFPGPPYRLSETPARLRPAPRLGEHNLAVYHDELGIPKLQLATLRALGAI